MINMGFGDCLVIKEGNRKLLVDCGSKYKQKYKNSLVYVDSDVNELLITHFHEDHYNCITDIRFPNLEKIYLPPLYFIKISIT